jgi:hypothetical protein
VLCKLDIEKAYMIMSIGISYLLRRCGFGEKLRSWIAHCISSVFFSLFVNGSPSGFFIIFRGLR